MSNVAANLAALNAFRAAAGMKPITAWKATRHAPMLAQFVAEQKPVAPAAAPSGRTVANPDAMRPINEELGQDIKTTREAWKASGAGITKKEFAAELMQSGTTVANLVTRMGITPTAARSLIGDVRRMPGATVTRDGDVYFVEFPADEPTEEDDE